MKTPTEQLETLWNALHFYRENKLISGEANDQEWDDICYAMAIIGETLEQNEATQ